MLQTLTIHPTPYKTYRIWVKNEDKSLNSYSIWGGSDKSDDRGFSYEMTADNILQYCIDYGYDLSIHSPRSK